MAFVIFFFPRQLHGEVHTAAPNVRRGCRHGFTPFAPWAQRCKYVANAIPTLLTSHAEMYQPIRYEIAQVNPGRLGSVGSNIE